MTAISIHARVPEKGDLDQFDLDRQGKRNEPLAQGLSEAVRDRRDKVRAPHKAKGGSKASRHSCCQSLA
ncbi:hypothetical protein E4191_16680 (plasmid) [Paracoccus liaowanqingii]|uniref:Uncharacterized protein n=1 Tax=Paracoccus liaowanqingii TaxID=2560053 RepID=A0A4Y5SR26_9RHOB|nr:hypothetical protein [Paracoccus liaowanqingii]QDA35799.1 hypothetical protein E4191_16680 [Paracoccus liaowanqingii]